MSSKTNQVLFLCTGNYFRSRFAEMLFNHLAQRANLNWRADSRGLDTSMNHLLTGVISPATAAAVRRAGILTDEHRAPIECAMCDLKSAQRVIALKEAEHRPLMSRRFPDWVDRIEYWHIHDVDRSPADVSLREIESRIIGLIAELSAVDRPN